MEEGLLLQYLVCSIQVGMQHVCVFVKLNRSFYPSTFGTTSVRADSAILERYSQYKFCDTLPEGKNNNNACTLQTLDSTAVLESKVYVCFSSFCRGVYQVASSDEADEDSGGETGTTTTTFTAGTVQSGTDTVFDAPCVITPNMSDAESAGQVSDASSHAAAKDRAGRDDGGAKVYRDGAVSPPPPPPAPPAEPHSSWNKSRHGGFSASFPPTRFAGGNAWRRQQEEEQQQQQQQQSSSCSSRITVRVVSALGVSGDLEGDSSALFSEKGREEEKDKHATIMQTSTRRTVSPPWPFVVSASAWRGAPASAPAAFYGDSLAAAAAAAAAGGVYVVPESHTPAAAAAAGGVYVVPERHTGGRQRYRGSDGGGGSICSGGEEVKFLGGFDRLRLVDRPTKPPVVGVGPLDPVWSCRGRVSSLGGRGGGMEVEADTALEGQRH